MSYRDAKITGFNQKMTCSVP